MTKWDWGFLIVFVGLILMIVLNGLVFDWSLPRG
jgi:hypothetical protein